MAHRAAVSGLSRELRMRYSSGFLELLTPKASQGQRSFSAATAAAAGTEHEGKPQHHRRGPTVTDMVGGTGLEQNFTDDEAHISGAVYSPPETAADWHGTSPGVSAAEAEAMSARNRATQAAAWASSAKSPADSAAVSADDPAISGVSAAFPKTGLARMAFFNDAGPLDVSDTAVGSVEFGKAPKGYPASGQQSRPGRGMDPIEEVL